MSEQSEALEPDAMQEPKVVEPKVVKPRAHVKKASKKKAEKKEVTKKRVKKVAKKPAARKPKTAKRRKPRMLRSEMIGDAHPRTKLKFARIQRWREVVAKAKAKGQRGVQARLAHEAGVNERYFSLLMRKKVRKAA